MQYAAHLPNTRSMVAPVIALAIGAAGATGIYAALDENAGSVQPSPVVITQTSPPAVSGPDEANVAAAVGNPATVSSSFAKDESTTAAAVGRSSEANAATGVEGPTPFSSTSAR